MDNKMKYNRFIAIDFETANNERNSACALGIVVVENLIITDQYSTLIKPPTSYFTFTNIHGITWQDVQDQPSFKELWPKIKNYLRDIDFVVAHNITFDKAVLEACCYYYNIQIPELKYECTCQLSRNRLKLSSNALDSVSNYYGIELDHHNALSDTLACAKIMINFLKEDGRC